MQFMMDLAHKMGILGSLFVAVLAIIIGVGAALKGGSKWGWVIVVLGAVFGFAAMKAHNLL